MKIKSVRGSVTDVKNREMTLKTPAKINLALDVTGKLENGYHSILSVFQTVGLYDEVSVELTDSCKQVICEVPEEFRISDTVPDGEKNIAYRTAEKFIEENGLETGFRIRIKKGIPSQAGMGGGSTDAAAVIKCLEDLTGKTLSNPEKIGADVPFFLTGGTALVEGIGERVTPIADYSGKIFVIAKGREGVSTAEAYKNIDGLENPPHPDIAGLVRAISENPDKAYNYFDNIFEQAVSLKEVGDIKNIMSGYTLSACMTGSGSAVFGLCETREQAEKCVSVLKERGYFAVTCLSVGRS